MAVTELWLVRHGESVANSAATRRRTPRSRSNPHRHPGRRCAAVGDRPGAGRGARPVGRRSTARLWTCSGYRRTCERARPSRSPSGTTGPPAWSPSTNASATASWASSTSSPPTASRTCTPRRLSVAVHLGKFYHRPPGGESWADVALRLRSFLRDAADTSGNTALVVAHDAIVMLLLYLLAPMEEAELLEFAASHTVLNASVTHLVRVEAGWQLVDFSAVTHLQRRGRARSPCIPEARMSSRSEEVTPALLRGWGLPDPGDSKKSRGRVMVVGGSRRSPGAVMLSGEAALRVGAGRVGLVVPRIDRGPARPVPARGGGPRAPAPRIRSAG